MLQYKKESMIELSNCTEDLNDYKITSSTNTPPSNIWFQIGQKITLFFKLVFNENKLGYVEKIFYEECSHTHTHTHTHTYIYIYIYR